MPRSKLTLRLEDDQGNLVTIWHADDADAYPVFAAVREACDSTYIEGRINEVIHANEEDLD